MAMLKAASNTASLSMLLQAPGVCNQLVRAITWRGITSGASIVRIGNCLHSQECVIIVIIWRFYLGELDRHRLAIHINEVSLIVNTILDSMSYFKIGHAQHSLHCKVCCLIHTPV